MRRCCTDFARVALVLAFVATGAYGAALDLDRALRDSQSAVGRQVGDYGFVDRDGARVRLSDYRGKPLLVSFVYTGCGQVCPAATQMLGQAVRKAQAALGAEAFAVVTIGFNVPFDTPEAMKSFARQQGIDVPNWNFLSPDARTIEELLRDFGFSASANAGGFDHLTQVTLLDAQGRVSRQVYGDAFDSAALIAALREPVPDAPAPAARLAELVQRVRILCSVYDPLTGRYRLNYALFIELFAGLSVLGATAYYVSNEWRRQRRTSSRRTA